MRSLKTHMSSVEFEESFLANFAKFAKAAARSGSKELDLFKAENGRHSVSQYPSFISVF